MAQSRRPHATWAIVALAALAASWMLFDGARALIVGDYVTPTSGAYAGELGPWAGLVQAIGIDPRSTIMKSVFVSYGAAWLATTAAFAIVRAPWTWWAMLTATTGALWYLLVGTLVSVIALVLLFLPAVRRDHALQGWIRRRSGRSPPA